MLSYLKEDGHLDRNKNQQVDADAGEAMQDQQEQDQNEYLMPADNTKMAKQGTLILVLLFVVGAAAVFLMIKKVVPSQAGAADESGNLQVESAIAKLTGIKDEMYSRLDQVAEKFQKFSTVNQVPAEGLVKNPFVHIGIVSRSEVEAEISEKAKSRQDKWKLWSIMESSQGRCCMINNKLLYEGDMIDNMKVVRIGTKGVELEGEGNQVVLRISQ